MCLHVDPEDSYYCARLTARSTLSHCSGFEAESCIQYASLHNHAVSYRLLPHLMVVISWVRQQDTIHDSELRVYQGSRKSSCQLSIHCRPDIQDINPGLLPSSHLGLHGGDPGHDADID